MRFGPRWLIFGFIALLTGIALSVSFAAGFPLTSDPLSVFSGQAPPDCTPETNTFPADQDSYVEVNSNSNFGGATTLQVNNGGGVFGGTTKRTLVRFALPALPVGCTVTSATLRLYNQNATSGRTIEALRITEPWQELTVNGNNIPASVDPEPSQVQGSGQYQDWTVTTQVQAMFGSNHGFLLQDDDEGGGLLTSAAQQQYQSREGTNDARDPQLVITWN